MFVNMGRTAREGSGVNHREMEMQILCAHGLSLCAQGIRDRPGVVIVDACVDCQKCKCDCVCGSHMCIVYTVLVYTVLVNTMLVSELVNRPIGCHSPAHLVVRPTPLTGCPG